MLRDVCLTYLESPAASPERESVSSIQLTVTYKDGKSETSDILTPEAEPSNEKADSSGSGGKTNVVFEVKEVADFPQASGFLDIQEIFVVTKNTDRETSQSGADVPPRQQPEISAPAKRTFVLSVAADEEQTEPLCLAKKCKPKYTNAALKGFFWTFIHKLEANFPLKLKVSGVFPPDFHLNSLYNTGGFSGYQGGLN